jgi:hypothetical protein
MEKVSRHFRDAIRQQRAAMWSAVWFSFLYLVGIVLFCR